MDDQQPQRKVPPPPPATVLGYSAKPGAAPGGGFACPRCHAFAAKPVSFTWWGGLIGPKMFNHTKCYACRYTFNRKTGKSNDTAIMIYVIVALAVVGLISLLAFLK